MSTEEKPLLKVLVFTSLFPHVGEPSLGVFVRNRLSHLLKDEPVEAIVIAPIPYFPFTWRIFGSYGRTARGGEVEIQDGITVYHPRFIVIPKIGMYLTPRFLAWSGINAVKRLTRQGEKFDIIDAHYLYPDGVAAAKLSRKLDIPVVMTARGSDVTQIAQIPKAGRKILNAIKQASHVITVSQSLKDKLTELGVSAGKMTHLRNGVDLEKFSIVEGAKAKICKRYGLNPRKPLVLFAGWLIPRKRVDIAIDAMCHLHEDFQMLVVGDGPLRDQLEAQISKLKLGDRVSLAGSVSPEKMPEIFSSADALILPSEREGWANVLLESMACGAPVVSRAVDGALELVVTPVAGSLVEGDDPAKYGAALQALVEARFNRSRVRDYAAQFDWSDTSKGQYNIFQKVIRVYKDGGTN